MQNLIAIAFSYLFGFYAAGYRAGHEAAVRESELSIKNALASGLLRV